MHLFIIKVQETKRKRKSADILKSRCAFFVKQIIFLDEEFLVYYTSTIYFLLWSTFFYGQFVAWYRQLQKLLEIGSICGAPSRRLTAHTLATLVARTILLKPIWEHSNYRICLLHWFHSSYSSCCSNQRMKQAALSS